MKTTNKPWVKINSDTYLECIVGNEAGLRKLEELIQSAIENKGADVEAHIKSDFKLIVCTNEAFEETESQQASLWQNILFYMIFVTWVCVLPITAIIFLVRLWF